MHMGILRLVKETYNISPSTLNQFLYSITQCALLKNIDINEIVFLVNIHILDNN